MTYVWETELLPTFAKRNLKWNEQWHLKKVIPKADPMTFKPFSIVNSVEYKVTVAWVTKVGERKWDALFVNHNGSRTFRSLKAAKAYALAVITLES